MPKKRLDIMFFCDSTGEQVSLPVNPENIEIKYERNYEAYEILEYGEIYVEGSLKPLKINLSFILPENSDTFNTDSKLIYQNAFNSIQTEYNYSSEKVIEILKKWTLEKNKIRLLIDDELNIECYISSFSKTTRESTAIKPCSLEIIEYKNPLNKTKMRMKRFLEALLLNLTILRIKKQLKLKQKTRFTFCLKLKLKEDTKEI